MADEEEYVFEDDYGDGGDDDGEEVTWETQIENDYADAKSYCDSNLEEALKRFKQVIADDQDKGKWTFKSYKGMFRACAKHRDEARMLEYYEKALNFQWGARTRNDIEKMINKFIDRSNSMPVATLRKIYDVTMAVISKDQRNFDKLWFSIRLRTAQLMLAEKKFEDLERELVSMHAWCAEGEQPEIRKATQKLNVYALEIQLHTEMYDPRKIRSIYEAAMGIKCAIAPPRVMGILRESGGKMYMRQSMWQEAYESFLNAFRSFDEAGDPRRISCLKYLILATMLSDTKINPFDGNDAKSYQNDPEIVAMTELINAAQKNDIKAFDRVLRDTKKSKSILEDSFIFSYLGPLIRKVRAQVICILVKPYRQVKLEYISQQLMISLEEAEALCVATILDGQLHGRIDQLAGVIKLDPKESVTKAAANRNNTMSTKAEEDAPTQRDRYALLLQLISKASNVHSTVVNQAMT